MRPCQFKHREHSEHTDTLDEWVNDLILRHGQPEQALANVCSDNAQLIVVMHRIDDISGKIIARQAREIAELRDRLRQVDTIATRQPWAVADGLSWIFTDDDKLAGVA